MGAVQEVAKQTTSEEVVTLGTLAELTGFPVDYIKRELLEGDEEVTEMTMTELRKRVLAYLDSNF